MIFTITFVYDKIVAIGNNLIEISNIKFDASKSPLKIGDLIKENDINEFCDWVRFKDYK